MADLPPGLLPQLLSLIDRLRDETVTFLDQPGDQQLWYNRGYANGMVAALGELGQGAALGDRRPDPAAELEGHRPMAWGRAYCHGEETGYRETYEIAGIEPS